MRCAQLTAGLLLAVAAFPAAVPRPAPSFAINLMDGSKLPVAKYRGKIVALVFISTTCTHCQHFSQVLNGLQKEYGPKGVQVLMSAMNDNSKTELPQFIAQFHPAYPIGWNDGAEVMTFMGGSIMTPGYVPKIVFIDRRGIIREQHAGEDPFFQSPEAGTRTTLDQMLKPRTRAARKQ